MKTKSSIIAPAAIRTTSPLLGLIIKKSYGDYISRGDSEKEYLSGHASFILLLKFKTNRLCLTLTFRLFKINQLVNIGFVLFVPPIVWSCAVEQAGEKLYRCRGQGCCHKKWLLK